jgi:death-on-curing protein
MSKNKKVYYMSVPDLLLIHYVVMDGYFIEYERDVTMEQSGVKSTHLFLSAINEPKQTFDGVDLYPRVLDKAAVLLRCLIKNHCFFNGNKRTAVLATVVFLEMNCFSVVAEETKLFRLAMTVVHSKPLITIERIVRNLRKFTIETPTKENRRTFLNGLMEKTAAGNAIQKVLAYLRKDTA